MKKLHLFTMLTLLATGYVAQADWSEDHHAREMATDTRKSTRYLEMDELSHRDLSRYIHQANEFIDDLKKVDESDRSQEHLVFINKVCADIASKFNSNEKLYSNLEDHITKLIAKVEDLLESTEVEATVESVVEESEAPSVEDADEDSTWSERHHAREMATDTRKSKRYLEMDELSYHDLKRYIHQANEFIDDLKKVDESDRSQEHLMFIDEVCADIASTFDSNEELYSNLENSITELIAKVEDLLESTDVEPTLEAVEEEVQA